MRTVNIIDLLASRQSSSWKDPGPCAALGPPAALVGSARAAHTPLSPMGDLEVTWLNTNSMCAIGIRLMRAVGTARAGGLALTLEPVWAWAAILLLMTTYRRLGQSGLHLFPLGLGTMQFGWTADEARSYEIMDAYFAAGGNFIDTADIYSMWTPNNPGGVSEEIIGRWVKSRGNRDQIVIATKVRGAMGQNASQGRNTIHGREGLSRRWILKACEDSLRRLQTDVIDLYQVHWVDAETPIEETLSALSDLVHKGYVRYIGCSNFSAWRLMQALWASDKHGFERFVSLQPEYSMVQPTRGNFEAEISKVCLAYGVGVVPYSPLAAGFLTGKYKRGQDLPESVRAQGIQGSRMNEQNWQIVDRIVEIAAHHGTTPTRVALAWQLQKPFIVAPIIGANSVQQLEDSLGAIELTLTQEDVAALDEVSGWQPTRTELEQ